MMPVESMDHCGIDVVDGDAEDNNDHILANSQTKRVPVIHSHRYVAVAWCEIHFCIG